MWTWQKCQNDAMKNIHITLQGRKNNTTAINKH